VRSLNWKLAYLGSVRGNGLTGTWETRVFHVTV
jgi:hypothetical protein